MAAKRGEHAHLHQTWRGLTVDDVREQPHVRDRLLRIGARENLANRRRQSRRRGRGLHHQILRRVVGQAAVRPLRGRQVHLRLAVALEPAHLGCRQRRRRWSVSRKAMMKRRPSAGWPAGTKSRTNDSLTTATCGCRPVSVSMTSRPRRSGMPIVSKKPGVTKRRLADARFGGRLRAAGRITGQMPPRIDHRQAADVGGAAARRAAPPPPRAPDVRTACADRPSRISAAAACVRIVSTPSARKPGSMSRTRHSARTSRPARDEQHDRRHHLGDDERLRGRVRCRRDGAGARAIAQPAGRVATAGSTSPATAPKPRP